jgi:hypothetical protein
MPPPWGRPTEWSGAGSRVNAAFQIAPASARDFDLGRGNSSSLFSKHVKEDDEPASPSVQNPIVNVPEVATQFAELAFDLTAVWVRQMGA